MLIASHTEREEFFMQKRLLTATLALCAILLFIGLMPVRGEAEIYDTVVRLHDHISPQDR